MDFKLDDIQEAMQVQAKEFAEKFLADRIEDMEVVGNFPKDIHAKMVEMGFAGLSFAEEYGGLGIGHDAMVLTVEQLAKVSGSAACVLLIDMLALECINLFGSEEQKKEYIGGTMEGKYRGSFAFTEPGTGSDPKQLTTIAKKVGDKYIINGVKRFISNASYEGPLVMMARDEGKDTCTTFIVPKFCEGYSISTPWEKVTLLGSPVYDIFLDNVEVPESAIVGNIGDGYTHLLQTTSFGKLGFSALSLGLMGGAFDQALKYVKEKMHRGSSIGKFQAIQLKVANIAAKIESSRYLVYKTAEDAKFAEESRKPADMQWYAHRSALTKAHVSDLAIEVITMCMNLESAYGVMKEYNIERFLRDALLGPHVEGQSDIQRVIAGSYLCRN